MSFHYQDPGDGRLLSVNKTVVRCNFASHTGVAFFQTQRIPCFNISELAAATDIWIKCDVYAYDNDGDTTSMFRIYDDTSGSTGIALYPCNNSTVNCVNMWANGTALRHETRAFNGFHSIKLHLVSHKTNGKFDFYLDNDDTPYYSYTGNVNNGNAFSKLYIQSSNTRALVSNIIICNDVIPSINDIVPYEKVPYIYYNHGTANKLTVPGTTVPTTVESVTGSAFYQTARPVGGCFGVPIMDDIWIKFDIYHKAGASRFRCYANNEYITGICLQENTTDVIAIFKEGAFNNTISTRLVANTLTTYMLHIQSGSNNGRIEIWVNGVQKLSGGYFTPIRPLAGIFLQSDDGNNLFSNVVISDSRANIESIAPCNVHADISCSVINYSDSRTEEIESHYDTIRYVGDWSFTDPGDGRNLIFESSNYFEDRIVRCNFASRTGVAFTAHKTSDYDDMDGGVKCRLNIPNFSEQDFWISFDVYNWQDGAVWITPGYYYDEFEYNNTIGEFYSVTEEIWQISPVSYFQGAESQVIDGAENAAVHDVPFPFLGLHTVQYHLVSGGGRVDAEEVYVDGVVVYSHTKATAWGDIVNLIELKVNDKALLSNIIISKNRPSIDTVVKHDSNLFKYTNIGTANGLTIPGTTVAATEQQSRTGTAFWQSNREKCFDTPFMDEVWIQFDMYRLGSGRFRLYANPAHNIGFTNPQANSKTIKIYEGDTDGGTSGNVIQTNQLQTILCHMKCGYANGLVEIWVDGAKVLTYIHPQAVDILGDFYLQSDNSNNLFSSVIITNNKGHLTLQNSMDAQGYFDISCEIERLSGGSEEGETGANQEGIATHEPIDLGTELMVGIGITLDGEGYAMIRTAGEDMRYTVWEHYVPCERLCRYIDVRLHVRNKITSASLTIDRRTISKTISKHLLAGENVVEYGEAFYNIPAVIPTAIGDGVTAHVVSKNKESCVMKITDNNDNNVDGDVDALIRGW